MASTPHAEAAPPSSSAEPAEPPRAAASVASTSLSTAAPSQESLRAANRASALVSFDKTILNLLKLDSHDLDIQEDALVVTDRERRKKSRSACDLGFKAAKSYRQSISLYDVLWAGLDDSGSHLVVDYADRSSKNRLATSKLSLSLNADSPDRPTPEDAAAWADLLRARAYGTIPQRRRAYVLVNPHAGPGGAIKLWEQQVKPVFDAARMELTTVITQYSGQAVDLCRDMDIEQYDMVVACSGDGLPHEVFNGLGKRVDAGRALRKMAVAHIPCGSGNAMACNLYGTHRASLAALAIVKGVVTPLDLVSITLGGSGADDTPQQRTLSFLSQAVGIVAEADLATEHLRWMGGARFTWGFLERFMKQKIYPCDLAVKIEIEHKPGIKSHYSRQHRQHELRSTLNSSSTTTVGGASTSNNSNTSSAVSANSVDFLIGGGDGAADRSVTDSSDEASASTGQDGLPPLRYGTVNDKLPQGWEIVPGDKIGNFYCGNMAYMAPDANFFSAALMNDGLMDMVTINGDIPLMQSLGMISSVENGEFFDHPLVDYRKVVAYRLVPKNQPDGYISIDGERVPFGAFQAEVHRGLGRVIAKRDGYYEAPGPTNWDKVSNVERFRA